MKKSCNNCKALDGDKCILGHKIKSNIMYENCIVLSYKPTEECEKPITIKALFEII